jgi:hypothetical protein
MDSSKEINDRERIAKQIAKTSDSIRKKYRALKTGKNRHKVAADTLPSRTSCLHRNTLDTTMVSMGRMTACTCC